VLMFDEIETDGFYNYQVLRANAQARETGGVPKWNRWKGIPGTVSPQVRVRCVHANYEGFDAAKEASVSPDEQSWEAVPGDCLRSRAVVKRAAAQSSGGSNTASAHKVIDVPLQCVAPTDDSTSTHIQGYCLLPSWMAILFIELAPHEAVVLEFEPHVPESSHAPSDAVAQFPVRPFDFRVSAHQLKQQRAHEAGHHDHPETSDDDEEAVDDLVHAAADWRLPATIPVSVVLHAASQITAKHGIVGAAASATLLRAIKNRHAASSRPQGEATGVSLVAPVRLNRRQGDHAGSPFRWHSADAESLQQLLCVVQSLDDITVSLNLRSLFVLVLDPRARETATVVSDDGVAWLEVGLHRGTETTIATDFSSSASAPSDVLTWLGDLNGRVLGILRNQYKKPSDEGGTNSQEESLPMDLLWEIEVRLS